MSSRVSVERREQGVLVLRNPQALQAFEMTMLDWFDHWAAARSEEVFIGERSGDSWNVVTYGAARERVRRIAGVLLQRGATASRPLLILAPNGITHALVMLAALHVGTPVASVAPAYATAAPDFTKLAAVFEALRSS